MKGSLVGNCPAVTIGIGGVTVDCILDTGSMVSTITESFYNKYLCDIPIVQECHLKLRAANGLEIPYVGYIEADVYVQPVNLRLEKRGILIVKDTQGREIPGLLGMNIIKECKDLVISGGGSAAPKSFRTGHCMQNWIKAFKDTSATIEGIAQVAGTDSVCVPANSISFVHVRGPHRKHWKFPLTPICIEPSSQIDRLLIINTVVEQGSGAFAVPVANLTSTDIWIPPRTRLGLMSECMLEPSSVSKVECVQTNVCEQTVVPHNDTAADEGTSLDLTALLPTDLRCTETQRKKIEDLFKRYSDIFIQHDLDMGYTSTVSHKIDTVDDKPVCQPYRRIPPSQYQEVKEHIQSLLDKNIITKSTSPYA